MDPSKNTLSTKVGLQYHNKCLESSSFASKEQIHDRQNMWHLKTKSTKPKHVRLHVKLLSATMIGANIGDDHNIPYLKNTLCEIQMFLETI